MKELRLAGISDMAAANPFLPAFMELYNAKFAKGPGRFDDLHRPLNVEPDRLREVLCLRDTRYVGKPRGLPGKYIDSYAFPDGRLEFRWKDVALPYSTFEKDQRVAHAAITENKHLSAGLEFIKDEQDETPPKPRNAGKQRSRYTPNGRRNDGWNSKLAKREKANRAASQDCNL